MDGILSRNETELSDIMRYYDGALLVLRGTFSVANISEITQLVLDKNMEPPFCYTNTSSTRRRVRKYFTFYTHGDFGVSQRNCKSKIHAFCSIIFLCVMQLNELPYI